MKTIAIFRNQLFKKSEVFIKQQAESIQGYKVCYVGRRMFDLPPNNAVVEVINRDNSWLSRTKELLNAVTMSTFPYDFVKNKNIQLIHAHFAIDALYALNVAKKNDLPLITTLHGFDVTTSSKKFLFSRSPSWINYYFSQNKLKKSGDKFICVSDFIAKAAINQGFDEHKIVTHYIGIDVEKYLPRRQKEEERIILHVARLVEKKGTSILLSALKSIVRKFDDYKLLIIGEGPLYPQLMSQVLSLGLSKHVVFLGAQSHDEVMKWMRKACLLVLPSITARSGDAEGLGMVLLEASATGVPVIGSRHGGITEVIEDEKTGLLVDEGDVNSLAEKMLFLIENTQHRIKMGSAARQCVVDKFNLKTQTKKLENIYEGLIYG